MARDLTNQVEVNKSLLKVLTELNDEKVITDIPKVIAKVRIASVILRNAVEQSKYDRRMGYVKKVGYFEE